MPGDMNFKEAVESNAEISNCYKSGLQAMGTNSNKVMAADTRKLCGSVDLDKCVAEKYREENRWDYLVCYDEKVFCVEVHPASTGEVKVMIAKVAWLKRWLCDKGAEIEMQLAKGESYKWITSGNGNVNFKPGDKYGRLLALEGLSFPKKILQLK